MNEHSLKPWSSFPNGVYVSPHKVISRQHGIHCLLQAWELAVFLSSGHQLPISREASGVQSDSTLIWEDDAYYFVEFAGSFANIALLLLFLSVGCFQKGARLMVSMPMVALLDCWAVCFVFIPGLGDAHDLSLVGGFFPPSAALWVHRGRRFL